MIARETGRALDEVLTDIERDRWLSAGEAVDYRLVFRIVEREERHVGDARRGELVDPRVVGAMH